MSALRRAAIDELRAKAARLNAKVAARTVPAAPDTIRQFASGATRDAEDGKPDYEGFLSPLVIEAYGRYMHHHRLMADGSLRDSDNWQRGIPLEAYMKSAWRHFIEWWKYHRGHTAREGIFAVCGLLFNAMGYLHEYLKGAPRLLDRCDGAAGTDLPF
jgi:hypothetical protein